MILRYYILIRAGRREQGVLCSRHATAREVLGWKVKEHPLAVPDGATCIDCGAASRTVLDATIAADDAAAPSDEPRPVPILPGQRRLWEGDT